MPKILKSVLVSLVLGVSLYTTTPEPAIAKSLQQAVQQVKRQHEGRIISARTVERRGRRVHVIRILKPNGVVKTVTVPANG